MAKLIKKPTSSKSITKLSGQKEKRRSLEY